MLNIFLENKECSDALGVSGQTFFFLCPLPSRCTHRQSEVLMCKGLMKIDMCTNFVVWFCHGTANLLHTANEASRVKLAKRLVSFLLSLLFFFFSHLSQCLLKMHYAFFFNEPSPRYLLSLTSACPGSIMFRHLTYHIFGFIQSKLLPVYFGVGSFLCFVAVVTFLLANPFCAWKLTDCSQVRGIG